MTKNKRHEAQNTNLYKCKMPQYDSDDQKKEAYIEIEEEEDSKEHTEKEEEKTREKEEQIKIFEENLWLLLEKYRKFDPLFNYVNYDTILYGNTNYKKFFIHKELSNIISSFAYEYSQLSKVSENITIMRLYHVYQKYFTKI